MNGVRILIEGTATVTVPPSLWHGVRRAIGTATGITFSELAQSMMLYPPQVSNLRDYSWKKVTQERLFLSTAIQSIATSPIPFIGGIKFNLQR